MWGNAQVDFSFFFMPLDAEMRNVIAHKWRLKNKILVYDAWKIIRDVMRPSKGYLSCSVWYDISARGFTVAFLTFLSFGEFALLIRRGQSRRRHENHKKIIIFWVDLCWYAAGAVLCTVYILHTASLLLRCFCCCLARGYWIRWQKKRKKSTDRRKISICTTL